MHFTVEQYTDHVDYTKFDLVRTGVSAAFLKFLIVFCLVEKLRNIQNGKKKNGVQVRRFENDIWR